MSLAIEILIIIILLFISAFFSVAEISLVSLSRHKVRQMVDKKLWGAVYVEKLQNNSQKMLSTILIGNNVVNVAASALTTSVTIALFDNYAVGIAIGVMTLLILVFAEITPKSIAAANNQFFSRLVAPFIWHLSIILAPIVHVLDVFLNGFIHLFGVKSQQYAITEDEIRSMVHAAADEGAIKEIEKDLIHNIFEFEDMSVSEIMTPKQDVVMIESIASCGEALELIIRNKYSRMPVFEGDKDNIVGMIYLKDLIKRKKSSKVEKAMRKPFFIPETKKISILLRSFQKRNEQMAVVVDEHGAFEGVVTLEDVVEEIVGDIQDETDRKSSKIKKHRKSWTAHGSASLDEINSKLSTDMKSDHYNTLSGFILEKAGTIPVKGMSIKHKKFRFMVEEADKRRILKVRIEKRR